MKKIILFFFWYVFGLQRMTGSRYPGRFLARFEFLSACFFLCNLFYDAVNSSGSAVSNGRMANDWEIKRM
jgi:hypothetical protein